MFNLSNILDSLDNVAKDVAEEDGEDVPSATWVRSQQRRSQGAKLGDVAADGSQPPPLEQEGESEQRGTENIKRDLRAEMSVVGKGTRDRLDSNGGGLDDNDHDLSVRVGGGGYNNNTVAQASTPVVPHASKAARQHREEEGGAGDKAAPPPSSSGSRYPPEGGSGGGGSSDRADEPPSSHPATATAATAATAAAGVGDADADVTNNKSKTTALNATTQQHSHGNNDKDSNSALVEELEGEIERLNGECLELEEQVVSLKAEGQEAWASYQRAQESAAVLEGEAAEELKGVHKAWSKEKTVFLKETARLKADCETSLSKMRTAVQERDRMVQMEAQALANAEEAQTAWLAREQELLTELAVARAGSAQGEQGLRDELKSALNALERMRMDHQSTQRHAQTRQTQLETAVAELTREVGAKDRLLVEMQQQHHQQHSQSDSLGGSVSEVSQELQDQLQQARAELQSERDGARRLESRLAVVERDYHQATVGYEDERASMKGALLTAQRRIAALEDQHVRARMDAAAPSSSSSNSSGGSGDSSKQQQMQSAQGGEADQVQGLSKQLLRKQQMVLELQAERSALKSRLSDMTAKAEHAERQLLEHLGGGDDEDDDGLDGGSVENGLYYRYKDSDHSGLSRRGSSRDRAHNGSGAGLGGSGRAAAEMERFGVKAPQLARAVNAIDSWTLLTGRYLRTSPLVRVGITVYLLVLHVWVFFVLALHTHSLDGPAGGGLADASPQDFVTNKIDHTMGDTGSAAAAVATAE